MITSSRVVAIHDLEVVYNDNYGTKVIDVDVCVEQTKFFFFKKKIKAIHRYVTTFYGASWRLCAVNGITLVSPIEEEEIDLNAHLTMKKIVGNESNHCGY